MRSNKSVVLHTDHLHGTNCTCSPSFLDKARCRTSALPGQGDDDGDENGEDGDGSAFSSGSFRPGKVVWAKVDGHEWWPAKVCAHTCNGFWASHILRIEHQCMEL